MSDDKLSWEELCLINSVINPDPPGIGDVLRAGDPEPDDGTPLLDAKGHVEPYSCAGIGGRWDRYVATMGPFVVAPDYAAAVAADERVD